MKTVKTSFTSNFHGFSFVNRFDMLPTITIPGGRRVDLGDWIIGLCGGMCYTALDYFHAGRSLPAFPTPEEIDNRLRRYLQKRQRNSVPISALQKLISWVFADDQEVVQRTLSREYPRLRFQLDYGNPAALILVRTQGFNDPTRNHQVVATGYTDDPDNQQVLFDLYDPNHPGMEPVLRLDYSDPDHVRFTQSTGETLRGFFVTNYKPKSPSL